MSQYSIRLRMGLRLVDYEVDPHWLDRVHKAIEKEIARGTRRLEKLEQSGNPQYLDSVADEECEQIEELLGVAFVACQSFINRILNRLQDLNEACMAEAGSKLPSLATRQEALRIMAPTLAGSAFTDVEVIYAVGNYWKHSEDWPTCEVLTDTRRKCVWDLPNMRPIQKTTAEVVSSIGLCYGSTGNLRTSAKVLGVSDYMDLSPIRRALESWAKHVLDVAQKGVEQLSRPSTNP